VQVIPLVLKELQQDGYIQADRFQTIGGKIWDSVSEAYCSTEFAITRFLVPIVAHSGWVLFCDCDVVFLDDPAKLLELADDRFAVMCVKHDMKVEHNIKMDGQEQVAYPRKNWSSVMLVNCDHPANLRMTVGMVKEIPGRFLHRFCWLKDEEIGDLPPEWNWLVGVQPKPEAPKLAHFTLGGPWIPGWAPQAHDELWSEYQCA